MIRALARRLFPAAKPEPESVPVPVEQSRVSPRNVGLHDSVRDRIQAPYPPLMESWAKTWQDLLAQPNGLAIKQMLDQFMPKSQVIIARKPLDAGRTS